MNGVRNLARIAGISTETYLANPLRGVVLANKRLDVDGMVSPAVPASLDEMRTGHVTESDYRGIEPEALLEHARSLPDSEARVLSLFDERKAERSYREYFERAFGSWEGIEPIPNFWEMGGHFPLYHEFGYMAFLSACAMYPEAVGKIWWARSLASRERAKVLTKLYHEYDLVPLMFCGEDLCNNKGPMVDPAFLRKHYFPTVRLIVEPLLDAGIRMIYHCDGDVRPLIDDFIGVGFSGFQGFQYELGIDPHALAARRSTFGAPMIFFAGMSVTWTLPFGEAEDIRNEIEYLAGYTAGGTRMFLFTTNVTGIEVPPENIIAGYEYVRSLGAPPIDRDLPTRWPSEALGS